MLKETKKPIFSLEPGVILANDILSEDGKVLLSQGQLLTAEHISYLKGWDIHFVDIVSGIGPASDDHTILQGEKEFNQFYQDTLQTFKQAFKTICLSPNISLTVIKKLSDWHIIPLIDVHGAIEYLYKIQAHCNYTYRHSINVAIVSGIIGKSIGLNKDKLKNLVLAGLLHDVGKLLITKDILDKPGKLTDPEMTVIKKHPLLGYELLRQADFLSEDVKVAVMQHHERNDGSGYPTGLNQHKIHCYAKVIAIADTYDAMTSQRVYRRKLTPFRSAETIAQQMYRQLDLEIGLAFLNFIKNNLINSVVQLSNGKKGKVVYFGDISFERPTVRLLDGTFLDLNENKKIEIVDIVDP
ncbi:MAG: HD-GYP domain-containing protein [Bacillota bacterium]